MQQSEHELVAVLALQRDHPVSREQAGLEGGHARINLRLRPSGLPRTRDRRSPGSLRALHGPQAYAFNGTVADLMGKTVLITGATSGIGFEASVALARQGARLVMVGRDPGKTARAVQAVRDRSGSSTVDSLLSDLASHPQSPSLPQASLPR